MAEKGTKIERIVGDYELFHDHVLGKGGFGSVYLGRDMRSNDSVAIKHIETPLQYRERYMKYIQNELDLLSSISHPNIVELFHSEQIGHCMYFILEFCECDLQKFACEKLEFQNLKFEFTQDIAEGLNCLHHNRIIHRDIKPENVLIKEIHETRTAKLSDLGLSRRVPGGCIPSFSATTGIGTKHWMAPELFADTDNHTGFSMAVDIFSFGLLLLSILTHIPGEFLCAISGPDGMSIGQWTYQQLSKGQPVFVPKLADDKDSAEVRSMKQIIKRMIHPQASQRYKIQEVCNAICKIRDSLFTTSMPTNELVSSLGLPLSRSAASLHDPDLEGEDAVVKAKPFENRKETEAGKSSEEPKTDGALKPSKTSKAIASVKLSNNEKAGGTTELMETHKAAMPTKLLSPKRHYNHSKLKKSNHTLTRVSIDNFSK